MSIAFFGPCIAEAGWEFITIQSYFREAAKSFDATYVCSFPESEFLYTDFCTGFIPHRHHGRALKWWDEEAVQAVQFHMPKEIESKITHHIRAPRDYRSEARAFIQYGTDQPISTYDYLIHPRNLSRGSSKNYRLEHWEQVVDGLEGSVASIGRDPDWHVKETDDLRGIDGDVLCRYMAGCKCVIGGSSGVMHLAMLCCAPIVTWGDSRTYFNETLEKRYKETWNPFKTPVEFIFDDEWEPVPKVILDTVGIQTLNLSQLTGE